jgi:hypothetical protein
MKRLTMLLLIAVLILAVGCDEAVRDGAGAGDDDADGATGDDDDNNDGPLDDHRGAIDDDAAEAPPVLRGRVCEPVAPAAWPEPDLTVATNIAWDDKLFFTVNGERFFPLGYYNVGNDQESLAAFKAEGFNVIRTGPGCCGSGTQPQIDFLNLAADNGLMVLLKPWSNRSDVLTRPEQDLADELAARNDTPGLFGWYTFDEPTLDGEDKELTERMHYILSTYSVDHPDMLVEQSMDNFNLYVDDCSVFMIDPYPIPHLFASMVKAAVLEARVATEDEKPVLGVMQSFSWDWYDGNFDSAFRPTGWEVRNMAWQFIVFGARGLVPWTYDAAYSLKSVPEYWAAWLADVAEMNQLTRVLLTDEAEIDLGVETRFPTTFDYVVKQEETATWVLSVSTSERPTLVTLDLSSLGEDLCVVDFTSGEVFPLDDAGKIEVEYLPLQVRIIEVMAAQ